MKTIKLSQGKEAIVDDDVYEELSKYKWCFTNGYASRRASKETGGENRYMHRVICPTDKGNLVIHLDGNKLNNQRENLAVRNRAHRSQAVATRASSGLKGVTFHHGKWCAQISVERKNKYLGRFTDKIAAAQEYDRMARMVYGKYAQVNFPEGHEHYVPPIADQSRHAV